MSTQGCTPGPSASAADWCPPEEAKPTQDRRQLLGHCVVGSLGHLGWRPVILTGFLREILVWHFGDPKHVEEPDLRKHIWREGTDSNILVESIHRWRGDLVEKRPAIVIKRNAFRNVRVLINDAWGTDERGNDHFTTLWVGSHTLFCIHGTGASTDLLATEVQRELTQFGPVIRKSFDLMKFQVTEVGPISELEEATENFVVPVTVGWAYQENWQLFPDALPLKSIQLSFDLGNC